MAVKKATKTTALNDALAAYRAANELTPKEAAVLARVSADPAAAKAFETFACPPRLCSQLLTACIEADLSMRTFKSRLDVEERMLGEKGRLLKLSRSVAALRNFLKEINTPPADRLTAFISYDRRDIFAMDHGLYLVDNAINARRQVAEETPPRLGATRKRGGNAGETAAIGLIGEVVRRLCGRPHVAAAATLAAVVLDCVVTEERLREASRTRQDRPWRSSKVVRSRPK